jgi:hypothetical protein
LMALTLAPFILAVSKGSDWGWVSVATIACFGVSVAAGFALLPSNGESPSRHWTWPYCAIGSWSALRSPSSLAPAPSMDSCICSASTSRTRTPWALLRCKLAWPRSATVGLVLVAPLVPRLAARFGCRQVIGVGFAVTAGGFAAIGFVEPSWRYLAFLLPLIAVAVGMGLSNGPASSAATAAVSADQVGAASGVLNMARYVGAAVATALAASIYASVTANRTAAGETASEALSSGLALASWVMAVFSLAGVFMALVMARHRAAKGTVHDSAAAAAAHTHTLPTSATLVIVRAASRE